MLERYKLFITRQLQVSSFKLSRNSLN